jgi:hypothetical protein
MAALLWLFCIVMVIWWVIVSRGAKIAVAILVLPFSLLFAFGGSGAGTILSLTAAGYLFYVWQDNKRKAKAENEKRERMQKLRAEHPDWFYDDDILESDDLESRVEELERKAEADRPPYRSKTMPMRRPVQTATAPSAPAGGL